MENAARAEAPTLTDVAKMHDEILEILNDVEYTTRVMKAAMVGHSKDLEEKSGLELESVEQTVPTSLYGRAVSIRGRILTLGCDLGDIRHTMGTIE